MKMLAWVIGLELLGIVIVLIILGHGKIQRELSGNSPADRNDGAIIGADKHPAYEPSVGLSWRRMVEPLEHAPCGYSLAVLSRG
jgi:multisubunit Na+/H+ antiporter MnhC subunit